MKGRGGRKRHDDVWKHVKKLNGDRVMCCHCEFEFAAPSATRISSHLYSRPGIRKCSNFGQAANGSSERDKDIARSCNLEVASRIASSTREHNKVNETQKGTTLQLQVDTKKKRISYQVGPFSISHDEYDKPDIQLIQYVFDPSGNPSEEVVIFPHYHLKRSEFTTFGPKAYLNAMVIDAFAENLTKIEEKKMKIKPTRNWYLPLLFSQFALDSDGSSCVERHNMKSDFMPSDLVNCDKIFIPIHIGPNSYGHFYLYVVHLKRKVVEIWDSMPSYTTEKERNVKTQKMLLVLDKLFEKDKSKSWAFAKFSAKMAENIPKQSNSYDCGIFVIKFMKDSANAMNNKLFESDEERLDLALELLKSKLNKERNTLFNKTALWYDAPHKEYQQMEDANRSPSIVIPQGRFIDGNDLEVISTSCPPSITNNSHQNQISFMDIDYIPFSNQIIGTEIDQVKSSGEEENKGHALRMNSMWHTIEHEVTGLAGKLGASLSVVRKLEVEVANLKAKSEKEKADLLAKITALEAKAQEEALQFHLYTRSSFFPSLQPPFSTPSFNVQSKNISEVRDSGAVVKKSGSEHTPKRPRNETPSPLPAFKVRNEKGDSITALRQLVSPFGKIDTASVLSEAIEYIKFLHEQVIVLSTPYMKSGAPIQHQQSFGKSKEAEGPKQDLRSRGLCLLPVSITLQ